MPRLTPRQRLTERVAERFVQRGFNDQTAYSMAVLAVHAWYGQNAEAEFNDLVSEEAIAEMAGAIPAFAENLQAAFEQALANARAITAAAIPWLELAERLNAGGPRRPVEFDASGLPLEAGHLQPHVPAAADRQGEPCIEEGCGSTAMPGTAFCAECMPQATEDTPVMSLVDTEDEDIANEVSLEDTGRPARYIRPVASTDPLQVGDVTSVEVSTDGGETWDPIPGVLAVRIEPSDTPTDMVEFTPREWHLSAARGLRTLGCTYAELAEMGRTGDFPSGKHHSRWFNISGTIDREMLDRAEYVLRGLEDETGEPANVTLSDQEIEALEEDYPTDRITGAPHHYIVNGDHSACGCGDHATECVVWSLPAWNHKPTLCLIPRTNCTHTPRHTYGQVCYFDVRPPIVGHTTEGAEVRGPNPG